MKVSITRHLSLGNGTRPRGFVLGDTDARKPDDVSLDNTTLAEGVEESELQTLMQNQQYMLLGGKIPEPEESQVDPFALNNKPTEPPADPDNQQSSQTNEGQAAGDEGNPFADAEKRALSITEVGLDAKQTKPLLDAGLDTVGKVMDYADQHSGLKSIKGVGPPTEDAVQAALFKLFGIDPEAE